MKTFQLLALLCLIIYTYQDCHNENNPKKEDCKTENFNDIEKKNAEYCCFIKDGDDTACSALSKYQYKHIKDMIKNARLEGSGDDYSIDCKSLYLQISLLSLLLLLL